MAEIHIEREHSLAPQAAARAAQQWADKAQAKFGLACTHASAPDGEVVRFEGNGMHGTLRVTPGRFTVQAQLGFLAAMFKERIEAEINKHFDQLLGAPPAPPHGGA